MWESQQCVSGTHLRHNRQKTKGYSFGRWCWINIKSYEEFIFWYFDIRQSHFLSHNNDIVMYEKKELLKDASRSILGQKGRRSHLCKLTSPHFKKKKKKDSVWERILTCSLEWPGWTVTQRSTFCKVLLNGLEIR